MATPAGRQVALGRVQSARTGLQGAPSVADTATHADVRALRSWPVGTRLQYHYWVPSVVKIVAAMRENPRNIRYADLAKVCAHYFGSPRTSGGAHAVYKTPWPGDPRVNIQDHHGAARAYQVRQVLAAIEKKEGTT